MNPSASGWINKFGEIVSNESVTYESFQEVYSELKKTGFVYGINIKVPRHIEPEHKLSEDEKAKINLLEALYQTYSLSEKNTDFKVFLDKIFQFYEDLRLSEISFFNKILTGTKTSAQLEKLIDSRVYKQ